MKDSVLTGQLNSEHWQDLIMKAIKKDGALQVYLIKDHGLKMSLFPPKGWKA